MGLIKGGFMRLTQTFIYFLAFLCSAVALGIYAYFLSVLADRNASISRESKAVTGIAGAGVLYTIIAVVLTCCLGGIAFFGLLAIILDIAFVGGFIAIAVLTRAGAHSCSGIVSTPLGSGPAFTNGSGFNNGLNGNNEITYAVSQRTACRLNKAVFAVSIIGAFLFLLAAVFQVLLVRSHKKEKRYGPSPANNYTSGSGSAKRNFWQRKKKEPVVARDVEMGTAPALAVPAQDIRPSYETGTTVGNGHLTSAQIDKVVGADGSHSGYYTQPTGTAANPYTNTAANY